MAITGEYYGVSLETENTNSLFYGVSIEFDINLIVTVLTSTGDPIDNSCVVEIYDAEDDTLLSSGNTNNSVFNYSVNEPAALRIIAIHPTEGRKSTSLVHDGVTVTKVTISFVPSILNLSLANPLRLVQIDSPLLKDGAPDYTFHSEQNFIKYNPGCFIQKVRKSRRINIQIESSYEFNTAQIYDTNDVAVGTEINSLKIFDFTDRGYDRYQITLDFSTIDEGVYYALFQGTDDLQGDYTIRTELFQIVTTLEDHFEIKYKSFDNSFEYDYSFNTTQFNYLYVPGKVRRGQNKVDSEYFPDDSGRRINLWQQVSRVRDINVVNVADWFLEKINLALIHDLVEIENERYTLLETLEPEWIGETLLCNAKGQIQIYNYNGFNRHDNNS